MTDMPPLTYGQIETLLTAMLDIDPDKTSAITARFNTVRRLKFPEGVNVGTTGRFNYDWKATLSTLVLFALIDSLVLPQQAVALVTRAWPEIEPASRRVLQGLTFRGGDIEDAGRIADAPLLVLQPQALAQLRPQTEPAPEKSSRQYRPHEPGRLQVIEEDRLSDMLVQTRGELPGSGLIVIDLHEIVRWTAQAIVKASWATPAQLGSKTVP